MLIASAIVATASIVQMPAGANGAPRGHAGAATPRRGGTVHALAGVLQANLAPTQAGVGNEDCDSTAGSIYGWLGYVDPKTGAVVLSFLKSITPSNHQKTWTLTLHPGLKFSDGTPFNAAAIAYTIKQQANPNNGDPNFKEESTWKTHVVNATTMTITLPTPDAAFPATMTQAFPWIGSPTAWKKEGIDFATHPVGAGPFKLKSWVQNDELTLVRNPYYKLFAPGQPYLNKLVFTQASQAGTTEYVAALQSHQYQAGWLQGSSSFAKVKSAGFDVAATTSSGGEYMLFNTSQAPFSYRLARKAVSYALSSQDLASAWAPGTVPWHNVFANTSPYYNPKYNFVTQDSAKAAQLFKKLQSEGINMTFSIVTVTAFPESADYVQATLDQYPGVHVNIVLDNINSYIQAAKDGQFGMFAFGENFVNPWPTLANNFGKNGSGNFGKWNDPAVNHALAVIAITQSPKVLKKEYETIAKQISSQFVIFPAQSSVLGYAYAKNLENVQTVEFGAAPLYAQVWLK